MRTCCQDRDSILEFIGECLEINLDGVDTSKRILADLGVCPDDMCDLLDDIQFYCRLKNPQVDNRGVREVEKHVVSKFAVLVVLVARLRALRGPKFYVDDMTLEDLVQAMLNGEWPESLVHVR